MSPSSLAPFLISSLQFLCVLCVLLLLQAVALSTALIFEKKVNLTHVSYVLLHSKQWLPAATVRLTTVPSVCSTRHPHSSRAAYERESSTTTMTWTSKISWTTFSRR